MGCTWSYADQETGLETELIMMTRGKRWMDMVNQWGLGGRQGDVPPGMGKPEPERDIKKHRQPTGIKNLSFF